MGTSALGWRVRARRCALWVVRKHATAARAASRCLPLRWAWVRTNIGRGIDNEESFAWPSLTTRVALECWKNACADPNNSVALLGFVNTTFCRAQLPPALMLLWASAPQWA